MNLRTSENSSVPYNPIYAEKHLFVQFCSSATVNPLTLTSLRHDVVLHPSWDSQPLLLSYQPLPQSPKYILKLKESLNSKPEDTLTPDKPLPPPPSVSGPWYVRSEAAGKDCKRNSLSGVHRTLAFALQNQSVDAPQSWHHLINSLCAHEKQTATRAWQDEVQSHLVPRIGGSASSNTTTLQASMPCDPSTTRWPWSRLHLLLIFCPFTRFTFLSQNLLFLSLKWQGLAFQNAN